MKRASVIVTVLLLSSALFAQTRGGPPSITPSGVVRSSAAVPLTPGVYNSLCSQPGCANAFFPYPFGATPASVQHPSHGHHHRPTTGTTGYGYGYGGYGAGYVYVPYAYPVPVAVAPDGPADAAAEEDPDPPAQTPFERRPVVQPAPYSAERPGPYAVAQPANTADDATPKHMNMSPVSEEKIPVVIVFKDGHQQEIANGNYAIVGDLLYDLSGPIAHKIKLADLDLTQTVQLNEQRGVEFSLPSTYKPQA